MVALLLALCIVIRYLFRQEVALLLFTELANQQLPGVQTTEQWDWPMFGVCGTLHRVCLRAGKTGYLLERDLPVAKQTPVSLLWQESSRVLSLAQYLLYSLSNQPQHRERSTDCFFSCWNVLSYSVIQAAEASLAPVQVRTCTSHTTS